MAPEAPVVAIDGPSGSGKGTVSRMLAGELGWHFLDSGALYRLVALVALRTAVNPRDGEALVILANQMKVRFATTSGDERIWLDGEEVSGAIRGEDCGAAASQVAGQKALRRALVARQRAFQRPPGLVADGRDMGSVVFPDAVLKVFLTANAPERARRRYKQLKDKGIDVSLSALSQDIADRDRRDAERTVAPLKPAADARILDSTGLDPHQVIRRLRDWLAEVGIDSEAEH